MASLKKKGANSEEDNSPRSGTVKNLYLKGEGRPRSPASSSAANHGSGDGGRAVKSRRGDGGDDAHEKGRRRPRAQGSLSLKGGAPASHGDGEGKDGAVTQ